MQLSPGTAFLRQAGSAARGLATCRLRSTLQKRAAPGTTNGDGTRPLAVRPAMLPVIAGKRCCSSCARVLFYRLQGLRAQRQVWGAQNRAVADSERWLQHGAGRYRDARQFCRSFCPKSRLRGTGVARLCPSRQCRGGSRWCYAWVKALVTCLHRIIGCGCVGDQVILLPKLAAGCIA